MKFSLKLLLAITVLAALTVNGLNNRHQSNAILHECELLEDAIATERTATKYFSEKKLIYERAQEAFERRKEQLCDADEFFRPVIRVHGKLDIQDPSKIHVFSVPGRSVDGYDAVVHERYRIWIPASSRFELCLGFHKTNDSPSEWPELRESYYFSPKKQVARLLNPGVSLIEFTVEQSRRDNSSTVHITIDGVVVHTATRKAALSTADVSKLRLQSILAPDQTRPQPKLIVSIANNETGEVFPADTLELVRAHLWPTTEEPESVSLMIQPIELEDKHQ